MLKKILIEEEKERDAIHFDRYDIGVSLIQPTLRTIIDEIENGLIYFPPFQRFYRWSIEKASKLIESYLLGLPVPPIFVYLDDKNRKVVIDGQQRLLTIFFFFKEIFPKHEMNLTVKQLKKYKTLEDLIKRHKKSFDTFKLKSINPKWEGLSYSQLNEEDKNWLHTVPLWIIIVRQIKPLDNLAENIPSSFFYIFERLNTGGEALSPMEIRKALYFGEFYELLEEINENKYWRKILGKQKRDSKLIDIELILRFLALSEYWEDYFEPMKEFLNWYMRKKMYLEQDEKKVLKAKLEDLFKLLYNYCGEKPFHKITGKLNTAFLDSFLAISFRYFDYIKKNPKILQEIYKRMLKDNFYKELIKKRVSVDKKAIIERFSYMENIFKEHLKNVL